MRGIFGLAVALIVFGSVSAQAQVRRAPMRAPAVRAVHLPGRAITYVRVRQARSPVRMIPAQPPVINSRPRQPAVGMNSLAPTVLPTVETSSPTITGSGGTPIPLGQLLNPTPGLGFDFNHLAAVNSGLAVRAFIDPITQNELATAERLPQTLPVFYPGFAATPVVIATPQPQVIVVQQPVPQAVPVAAATPPPASVQSAPTSQPPLPNVGDFLLVRRDGSVIHAVAFSEQDGQIVYITSGGSRRSVSIDQLNFKATEQRNAENGTMLHLTQ